MPAELACPNCGKAGFVRVEYVISGASSHSAYYCGSCEHHWSVNSRPPAIAAKPSPLPKPRTRTLGRKRTSAS